MRHTTLFVRLRESTPFAWWTAFVWSLFVASIAGEFSRLGEDPLIIAWWLAGGIGVAAGVLGIFKRGTWVAFGMFASAILVISSALYWERLIETLLSQEEQRVIETVLGRVWHMVDLGLRVGTSGGTSSWVIATYYREIVMPILQLLTLLFVGLPSIKSGKKGNPEE